MSIEILRKKHPDSTQPSSFHKEYSMQFTFSVFALFCNARFPFLQKNKEIFAILATLGQIKSLANSAKQNFMLSAGCLLFESWRQAAVLLPYLLCSVQTDFQDIQYFITASNTRLVSHCLLANYAVKIEGFPMQLLWQSNGQSLYAN